MIQDIIFITIAFGLVVSGAFGVILPLLPGVPIAWLGMLLFAYATEFTFITAKIIFIFLGLTLLTFALDALAPLLGAKKFQASKYGLIGSVVGLLVGIMFLGPIGFIAGPFIGAFAGELFRGADPNDALKSARGVAIGFIVGSALKLALIMVMLGFLIMALL
ncbi:MAG: DUF456 domain-containing protein [bacterium]|nr:DUF456 domain-containing protein [bacterium]